MKRLTAKDLKALNYGDKVYRFNGHGTRGLRFVGFMPSSPECYLIFSDGEYLEHLYINQKDGSFNGEWFGGEYDSYFVGELKLRKQIDGLISTKTIYLDKDLNSPPINEENKEALVESIMSMVKVGKSFHTALIEFGKFITNSTDYDDFWAMSDELQKEILDKFIKEQEE